MSIERKLIGTTDAATSSAVYVEDVFSTWLYNGTGSSQTITNGIDLSTKGGIVWIKGRSGDYPSFGARIIDSVGTAELVTSSTGGSGGNASAYTFTNSGFVLPGGGYNGTNGANTSYASWTFAKQAKFFDVVTFSTDASGAATFSHALSATPGMVIIKRTGAVEAWYVYHRSLTTPNNYYLNLNTTGAQTNVGFSWITVSSSSCSINGLFGTSSGYVAYLFADSNSGGFGPAGTDSVVACGSYAGTGSDQTISLGWEPQFVLVKPSNQSGFGWYVYDNMRGLNNTSTAYLEANTSGAEATGSSTSVTATATGFRVNGSSLFGSSGFNFIYIAIRRGPMRTPTDATKVFSPNAVNVTTGTKITTGFPVDLQIYRPQRSSPGDYVYDRLRGVSTNATDTGAALIITSTAAEAASSTFPYTAFWDNTGYRQDAGWQSTSNISWNFRRAPGFFDVVCYTGNVTSNVSVNHSLGVAPEMVIMKQRDGVRDWLTWHYAAPSNSYAINRTDGPFSNQFNSSPTSTQVVLNAFSGANQSGNYVMYLFATCPGVSKVGSYTGNGSSQTIDCGFASGARFVLIKRTDAAGNWLVADTSRGINGSGSNDPLLYLNSTAAEVTTADWINPNSSGFIVNQEATANANVNGAIYVFLSIA